MKQVTWITTLLLAVLFGGVAAAQADEHYDATINTIYEVENLLELISSLKTSETPNSSELNTEKEKLKNLAIAKIKSI